MNSLRPKFGALTDIIRVLPLHQEGCGKKSTSCIQKAGEAFFNAISQLGFAYGRFTFWREDILGELKLATYSHSMSNFPAGWEAEYREKQMFHHDPVLLASQLGDGINQVCYGTWQDALSTCLSRTEDIKLKDNYRSVYGLAEQYSVYDGVYFAFGSSDNASFISCTNKGDKKIQPGDAIWQGLYALSVIMDAIIDNTLNCSFCIKSVTVDGGDELTLTDKQVAVLGIFSHHPTATAKSVAKIMGVEPETVNFHLKQIRRAFKQPRASGHALAKIAKELHLIQ